jgi:predicted nucleic acid-binding protein
VRTCAVVLASEVSADLAKYRKLIKEKDLEQLTVVKKLGIKHLVALDRDFDEVEEYITPRRFVHQFGLKAAASSY